jgi:hypothetical protein
VQLNKKKCIPASVGDADQVCSIKNGTVSNWLMFLLAEYCLFTVDYSLFGAPIGNAH